MDSVSVVLYFNVNEVSALLKSFGYFNCSFININVRGGGGMGYYDSITGYIIQR